MNSKEQVQLSSEQTRFNGKIIGVVEDELRASIDGDEDRRLRQQLYEQWCEAGKPKNVKAWLRPQLTPLFPCLDQRPRWVESHYKWPFFNGVPMTFVGQLDVPDGERVLYIFSAREWDETRENVFRMRYELVEQFRSLKGVVARQKRDGSFELAQKSEGSEAE